MTDEHPSTRMSRVLNRLTLGDPTVPFCARVHDLAEGGSPGWRRVRRAIDWGFARAPGTWREREHCRQAWARHCLRAWNEVTAERIIATPPAGE